jgi:CheY-like chemotaxis protein
LPKAAQDDSVLNVHHAPDNPSRSAALARRPVLIVEDDADLREMMAQLLALEGYQTAAVANGREALEFLGAHAKPDVILLDLMMPIMDGWEFCRQQQADPDLAPVPVIVLSALDQSRAADIHAAAFLKKPLDFDRLLELVRRFSG